MLRGSHDNWEKLVGAVLNREELRRITHCESLSSSSSVDFSFDSVGSPGPMKLKEVKKATKGFPNNMWIGRGAFGPVFRGWIDEHTLHASNSRTGLAIAVKKWTKGSVQLEGYLKEINYLGQYRHPNLLELIGYCSEGDDLFLVY